MQSVQVLWQSRNYILEANHVAGSIITQFCRVRCLANKVGMEYLFQRFIFDCDFKACIVTYRHRFRCPHCCTDKPQQRLTCILALIVGFPVQLDRKDELFIGIVRLVFFCCLNILLKCTDSMLGSFDLARESHGYRIFQSVMLAGVGSFQGPQPRHLNVQVHLFLDHGVTCCKGFHLGISERSFVQILAAAGWGF